MSRKINLAAIRMDAAPAPTEQRLERAAALVARAADQQAQIAVLPEVFNTGYEYTDKNYALAEPIDGPTVSWMKSAARKHNLYLAGTLLLRETDGIYNAMLLISPNGQLWRYDKSYPWAWERAYFCPRKHPIQPAETEFGKIGMLICWDTGHANLWAAYAGKVDLMLVSSCPPLEHEMAYHFPDGRSIKTRTQLGPLIKAILHNGEKVFSQYFLEQTVWLGVPSVNTSGSGVFHSHIPRPRLSLAVWLAARPDLWKYIPQAEKVYMEMGYFDETFIADANGQVLNRTKLNGDDLAVAQVELAGKTPIPQAPQPKIDLSPLTYRADELANALLVGYYEKRWKLS
jgi:hypothetical protein